MRLDKGYNIYYTGTIHVGTELAEMPSIAFDTAGAWMVL